MKRTLALLIIAVSLFAASAKATTYWWTPANGDWIYVGEVDDGSGDYVTSSSSSTIIRLYMAARQKYPH